MSDTGIAGLSLGGGFGYLTRRFGWTIDSLEEVELVTADGQIRIANAGENEELFWALRGGGGNFGVATRFTFRLYDVAPMVTGGLILWDAERAEEVLARYRDLTESAPRELTAVLLIRLAPPAPFVPPEWRGKPVVGMVVCYSGTDAEADLAPIRALGNPIVDLIIEKRYVAQQSMLDVNQPKGVHYFWKSEFVRSLSPRAPGERPRQRDEGHVAHVAVHPLPPGRRLNDRAEPQYLSTSWLTTPLTGA